MAEHDRHKGFSLIEMAIITVIVGIIIATVLPTVLRRMETRIFRQGKQSVVAVREEVLGFVLDNCRLPNDLSELSMVSDRWSSTVRYRPDPSLIGLDVSAFPDTSTLALAMTDGSGTYANLACVVAGNGENRTADLDLTASPIQVPPYGQGSDDIVDFLTIEYLKQAVGSGCGSSPAPSAWHETFDDLDDWDTGNLADNYLITDQDGQTNYVSFESGREETTISMPVNGALRDVWGFSATDIWAVGDGGLVLHYGGAAWSDTTSGLSHYLLGLWGASSSDLFAVGRRNGSGQPGSAFHYDGTSWSDMLPSSSDWLRFQDVYGTASDDVRAVSDSQGTMHYDGMWSSASAPLGVDLAAIWASASGHYYAVGENGAIRHFTPSTSLWSSMASGSGEDLASVWGTTDASIFAVGEDGEILYYDGSSWAGMASHTSRDLLHVWGFTPDWAYATVDANDALLHYNGDRWCDVDSGSQEPMRAMWGPDRSDIWAVGGRENNVNGQIVHLTGLGGFTLRFGRVSDVQDAWSGDTTLGYDVQVKQGWFEDLEYGMSGINFRWHESSVPDEYEGYGVSFMFYSDCNSCGDEYDMLESTLKPRGAAIPNLSGTHLILVWKQALNAQTGKAERVWLAYDLIPAGDDILRTDYADPGRFYRYATLNLRVRETVSGPDKETTLQVFYGTPVGEATGDATPDNTHRLAYEHSNDDSNNIVFPNDPVSSWTAADDYFTLVEWDAAHLNPAQAGEILLEPGDDTVIVLTEFDSPDTFDNRPEVALHGLGNIRSLMSGNNHERDRTILFDDFAIQYQ